MHPPVSVELGPPATQTLVRQEANCFFPLLIPSCHDVMASFTSSGGSRAQGPGFNFAALSDFSNISAKGQDHLKNVGSSSSLAVCDTGQQVPPSSPPPPPSPLPPPPPLESSILCFPSPRPHRTTCRCVSRATGLHLPVNDNAGGCDGRLRQHVHRLVPRQQRHGGLFGDPRLPHGPWLLAGPGHNRAPRDVAWLWVLLGYERRRQPRPRSQIAVGVAPAGISASPKLTGAVSPLQPSSNRGRRQRRAPHLPGGEN